MTSHPQSPYPSCSDVAAGLTARLSGELSREEEAALASHLEGCAACRDEERRLSGAWAALDDRASFAPSARFQDATLDRMTREILARKVVPIRRPFAASPALAWAASILLAAGLGWTVGRFGRTVPSSVPETAEPSVASFPSSAPSAAVPASTPVSLAGAGTGTGVVPVSTGSLVRPASTSGAEVQPLSESVVYILVKTLREDRNPNVRKRAAEALAGLPPSPELRDAFAGVLAAEKNPAIRIVAVEALARSAKETRDPLSVEVLRERASDQRESGYVRSRAAGALAGLAL